MWLFLSKANYGGLVGKGILYTIRDIGTASNRIWPEVATVDNRSDVMDSGNSIRPQGTWRR